MAQGFSVRERPNPATESHAMNATKDTPEVGIAAGLEVPSYTYPPGTIMPKICFYCKSDLEPEDRTSGRCEWCRMPWGPLGNSNAQAD